MSPIAKMCGTLVRIWMSTGMKPRSLTFDAGLVGADLACRSGCGRPPAAPGRRAAAPWRASRLRTSRRMPSFVASAPTVFVFSMMLSKRGAFSFCQTLTRSRSAPVHQAVEHLDDVEPRAERRVHRAHLEADDAAADDQHALRHARAARARRSSRRCADRPGMNGSFTASRAGGDDRAARSAIGLSCRRRRARRRGGAASTKLPMPLHDRRPCASSPSAPGRR